jgi:L-threonylcarbamoyladenylate synthase
MLRGGECVAFPTETVYGLGADARNGTAVAQIFDVKGRPIFNPLIVHVQSTAAARDIVEWPQAAAQLAAAFWPGPLTLVLPLRAGHDISPLVTTGLTTLAVRMPDHPVAKTLLAAFDGPIAAPSANPSGRLSPTTADHVLDGLSGHIAAVVDGGACRVGLESTIVGLDGMPCLLRPGGLPVDAIERVLGQALTSPGPEITAPGQLMSHYAPGAALRMNATTAQENEVLLGFGKISGALNLSPTSDLREAAANLFEFLHALDKQGRPIAVAPVPDDGLGRAINDRLRRAAAPRSP